LKQSASSFVQSKQNIMAKKQKTKMRNILKARRLRAAARAQEAARQARAAAYRRHFGYKTGSGVILKTKGKGKPGTWHGRYGYDGMASSRYTPNRYYYRNMWP
jgi:hypothetical protein